MKGRCTTPKKGKVANSLDRIHPENDMPQKLHYTPGFGVVHLCIHHPLTELLVVAQGALPYSVTGNGELSTACCAYFFHWRAGWGAGLSMRLLKGVGGGVVLVGDGGGGSVIPPTGARSLKHTSPNIGRNMCIVPVGFLTSWIPIASQIHVAILLHKGNL